MGRPLSYLAKSAVIRFIPRMVKLKKNESKPLTDIEGIRQVLANFDAQRDRDPAFDEHDDEHFEEALEEFARKSDRVAYYEGKKE